VVEVVFARAFRRHVDCPDAKVIGATVGDALGSYFAERPDVRSYVLDETGALRKHVAVFLNDELVDDRDTLCDAVFDGDVIQVFQALSGG
jgi:sulfur carrier protein ThiS